MRLFMDINITNFNNDSTFNNIESYIFIDNNSFICYVVPLVDVPKFLLNSPDSSFTVITNKTDLKNCLNLNILDCEVL